MRLPGCRLALQNISALARGSGGSAGVESGSGQTMPSLKSDDHQPETNEVIDAGLLRASQGIGNR